MECRRVLFFVRLTTRCATTCCVLPVRWRMLGAWPTCAGICYALVMHLALAPYHMVDYWILFKAPNKFGV